MPLSFFQSIPEDGHYEFLIGWHFAWYRVVHLYTWTHEARTAVNKNYIQVRIYLPYKTSLSNKTELFSIFVISTFQWCWGDIVEPGVDLTVGGDTFHIAAKPSVLYSSRYQQWNDTSDNRLALSRICGCANSKEVGSYTLSVLFFPILD